MPVFERPCLPAATGCQFLSAVTSVRRRFRAALRQAKRLTVRGRYADFIAVSLVANVAMGQSRRFCHVRSTSPIPLIADTMLQCRERREVPILLQKSAIVSARRLPRFLERLPINRPLEGGSIDLADTFCLHWSRRTCIDLRWWPGDKLCKPT